MGCPQATNGCDGGADAVALWRLAAVAIAHWGYALTRMR
jgi:hypothetical protein